MVGTLATVSKRSIPAGRSYPTPGDFTICTGMHGNGARTGTTSTATPPPQIRPDPQKESLESSVAEPGFIANPIAAHRYGSPRIQTRQKSIPVVFEWPTPPPEGCPVLQTEMRAPTSSTAWDDWVPFSKPPSMISRQRTPFLPPTDFSAPLFCRAPAFSPAVPTQFGLLVVKRR